METTRQPGTGGSTTIGARIEISLLLAPEGLATSAIPALRTAKRAQNDPVDGRNRHAIEVIPASIRRYGREYYERSQYRYCRKDEGQHVVYPKPTHGCTSWVWTYCLFGSDQPGGHGLEFPFAIHTSQCSRTFANQYSRSEDFIFVLDTDRGRSGYACADGQHIVVMSRTFVFDLDLGNHQKKTLILQVLICRSGRPE